MNDLKTYFISYNTKNNFFIPKKLFYDYNIVKKMYKEIIDISNNNI